MRFFYEMPFQNAFNNRTEIFNYVIIYTTLVCQIAMSLPSIGDTMMKICTDFYIYSMDIGLIGNGIFAVIATYYNILDYRLKEAKRRPYLKEYERLKKELQTAKNKEDLKKEIIEMKMVIKTFSVRDLKHLLEENGHASLPFIENYIKTFRNHPAAMQLIMDQVTENEIMADNQLKRKEKLVRQVQSYQIALQKCKDDVNRMRDEDNKGQYEDFKSQDYRFNRANMNQVEFKPKYQQRKKSKFGKMQARHIKKLSRTQTRSNLEEIPELSEET